ncbi:MAG: hypothetical protein KF878_27000 [Planctomycetes bacterium]|nr:hypothetical protein [Planctomycetota bacterium]
MQPRSYFNVLITTAVDIDRLTLGASIPADFGPKGANATHLYVGEVDVAAPESSAGTALRQLLEGITLTDLPADSTVFLTIHVHYGLKRLPSEGYLPRDYDFRAAAVAEIGAAEFGASSTATATGVRKR